MAKLQILLLVSLSFAFANSASFPLASSKIDASVTSALASSERNAADILVRMSAGTQDLLSALSRTHFSTRTERSSAVYHALTARALTSQANLLSFIRSSASAAAALGVGKVRSLWITNMVAIEGASPQLIQQLAAMEEVGQIHLDAIETLDDPAAVEVEEPFTAARKMDSRSLATQWGIEKVQAPATWNIGYTGAGITVANIDTGVRYTHEILRGSYKNDGHSWLDPHAYSANPNDIHSHGTHTMGTVVGADGYGVAPGAKWIACKGLDDSGSGQSSKLMECGQFLVCPTTPSGSNADCSKTPHVVCNSWGGSGGRTLYDDMFSAWHSAGIIPVFSNGNSGTSCSSAGGPADRDVIGVGSTTSTDSLSTFSGVGPSLFNELKPDISAPGSSVLSAGVTSDSAYTTKSGTSMACPHVTGAVALVLSKNPNLNYAQVKNILQNNADRVLSFSGATCGGIRDNVFPNHHFGHGRLNTLKAVQAA